MSLMKKTLLSISFFLFIIFIKAQHFKNAFQQLAYVNKVWLKQPDVPAYLFSTAAKPYNEKQLIAFHLEKVIELLKSRSTSKLSKAQQQQRLQHIVTLTNYKNAGVFPINTMHVERQPYFIDYYNNYCAVGYLMQQSGSNDMARSINKSQNFNFLSDIKHPALKNWAYNSGLSFNELALIQPAYGAPWEAGIFEFHYNNTGNDVNEYIEIYTGYSLHQQLASIDFYNQHGVKYKSLIKSQLTQGTIEVPSREGEIMYYIFAPNEFLDEGKIEVRVLPGNLSTDTFVQQRIIYNKDSTVIYDSISNNNSRTRTYYIGESENTPAGKSLAFCGHFYASDWDLGIKDISIGSLSQCVRLPLNLLGFNYKLNKNSVSLEWSTENESKTSHFEIEKSNDGTNFTKIGRVKAAGTSSIRQAYTFIDVKAEKLNHYRLKMIDLDGRFTYSKILFVKLSTLEKMVVSNPVFNTLNVQINLENNLVTTLSIYNNAGILIKKIKANSGSNSYPVLDLPKGHYLLQLTNQNGKNSIKKFIKM